MKKTYGLLTIGMLLGFAAQVNAQWVTSGTKVYNLGNVGIGVTNPLTELHIEGIAPVLRFKATNLGSGVRFDVRDQTGDLFRFQKDGVTQMVIRNTGNVGIGVTSTSYKLEVNGTLKVSGAYTQESTNPTVILKETGVTDNNWDIQVNNGDFKILKVNDARSTFDEVFHISDAGNVGIGAGSPDSKLTVKGTVKSKEVIVEATAGADFVFEEDYDLPTLAQIEKFIKANRHLEGIASAEEMKKNGVKVGELQIKLLQKIEELTLYAIEQDKYNKVQQKALDEQQKLLAAQADLIREMKKELEKIKMEKN